MGKDAFQIKLDVHHFSPHEIVVKAVENHMVVEGKHDEVRFIEFFIIKYFIKLHIF